jgi:hypothetical protein
VSRVPDVFEIGEDEGLPGIEADGDDVLDVLVGEAMGLLQGEILPQELLIVGHLDHQRDVEGVLQVPARVQSSVLTSRVQCVSCGVCGVEWVRTW